MSFSQALLKFIAARFNVPPDALDYFFAGAHIGRPAETSLPYPAELIPVGARLVLRGWLNQKVLPASREWILPYWAERQCDPKDVAFMPRGFNLYTINYTHRDWTMIGNRERAAEPIVDPRGLVTPWFDGWSLDVWVAVDGRLYAPSRLPEGQVAQSLYENLPIVVTEWPADKVRVRSTVFATIEEDAGEWVVQETSVENSTREPRRLVLYVSVRPFNPEGVSLVKRVEYRQATESLGAFRVDDALAVLLPKPDDAFCCDLADGDVALALQKGNGTSPATRKTRAETPSGLASGVAAYTLELAPGAHASIAVRMPVRKLERDDDDPDLFKGVGALASVSDAQSATISGWEQALAQGMRVRLPDQAMQNAFDANKAFLLLLHDGDSITPGPFTYHQFWARDAAYLLNALDKLGYHAQARQVLDKFPRRLEKDGYLRSTEGEWDSNGAAIWAMVENARLSGDKTLVAQHYWALLRMASWINSKRQNTKSGGRPPHYGLLPPGPSAEHLGPSDYYYWDDFWGLAGLRDATVVAEWVGLAKDADKLRKNYSSFRADVDASLTAVASRLGRAAMPASPYRREDAAMVGSLAALYPLRLYAASDPRIVDTIAALKETAWVNGAYFNDVGHSAYGTYLALHIAQCLLFQRNPDAWEIIAWVLGHASPTYTWAEGLHPKTLRGGMGDGHHGWALADFLLAVRNLLLFEEDDHLVITPGMPNDWTAETNVVQVQDAATYFGKVGFTLAFGDRAATLVVDADWRDAAPAIEWDLPFPVRDAGAEGGVAEVQGNKVLLPSGVERVVATW